MKFITAIYNGLNQTIYGGRLNRDRHYLYSLRCLSNLKSDIVCYTQSEDKEYIEEYLNNHKINNIELREYNLHDISYHEDIQKIKKINTQLYSLDNVWEQRCVELMWLKIIWIYEESQKYLDQKIMWIDAGLSHGGIIPKKWNIDPDNTDYETTFQNTLAFNTSLVNKLDKLSNNNKLFSYYCNNRQHNYPELFLNEYRLGGSICAGLFGGSATAIKELYNDFFELVDYMLNHNTLMQEEMIMTLIYQVKPELFNIYAFDTWYHQDWDCYNPELKSFSQFFEDL